MMRNRNTPWESASLVLAVPFVAVALFLFGCGDEGSAEATAAKSKGQEPIVQLHQGEAQGTTYSIKYLSEERLEDAVFEDLLEVVDEAVNLWRPESTINAINAWDRTDSLFGFVDSTHIIGPLWALSEDCLLYTSPSPRDLSTSRMPSSA